MASAYSPSQIDIYEEYISLPTQYRVKNNPALTLEYLTCLHMHQISSIPYENLLLHYSPDHSVSLDPQKLFTKIITNARGRGGYCLEGSTFFNHILRALGFQVYTAGVRIRRRSTEDGVPRGDYTGWFHIVNIVTLPQCNHQKYMVDIAFGGDGATKPLPLISGHSVHNLGTQEIRLIYESIPQQIDQSKPLWIYQYRNNAEQEWNSFYAFSEHEFLDVDFEMVNFYVSRDVSEGNFQVGNVLVVGFLRGRDGRISGRGEGGKVEGEVIIGKRMLINGVLKENLGGKTRVIKVCENEDERVRVLKEVFGIVLLEEEIAGIRGRSVELRGEGGRDGSSVVLEGEM